MQYAIEFLNTTKAYRQGFYSKKQYALQNLSLNVPQNSIYGFLGANGAGKTTAIKMLMGLQFPTSGKIKIFGGDVYKQDIRSRIGYLPERPYFHETMTASEFLNFHRSLYGRWQKKTNPSNEELLKIVNLSHEKTKKLKDFSKGMLQRIGIAQTLINDPDLVILDEPMSGLDPIGRKEVRNLILHLHTKGKSVFFSSHILSDIESICHRIAFLEKGKLKYEGTIKEIHGSEATGFDILFKMDKDKIKHSPKLAVAQKSGEFYFIQAREQYEVQTILQEIWTNNGTLISASPEQKSLEEFLFGSKKV